MPTKRKTKTFTLDELVQSIASLAEPASEDVVLDRLDHLYQQTRTTQAGLPETAPEPLERVQVPAEAVVLASASDAKAVDRFAAGRKRLGIDEEHPNLFFLDVLLTHADKVVANAGNDMIPLDEMQKALSSLILQPMDVSPSFDRHMRERLWDYNGIRGVIYDAEIVTGGDYPELWVGLAFWARDFPDLADAVAQDAPILGSSFDLTYGAADTFSEGYRVLRDIKFLGGTVLYKTRAADQDTQVQTISYMGVDLTDATDSGGSKPMDTPNTTSNAAADSAILAQAQATIGDQMTQIAELEGQKTQLAAENTRLAAELQAAQASLETANRELEEIRREQRIAELTASRMAELDGIPQAFAGDEEREAAASTVGAMSDDEYAAFKTQLTLTASARREAALLEQIQQANAQIAELTSKLGTDAEAAIVHNDEPTGVNTGQDIHTGAGDITHNQDEPDAFAQAGSLSAVASANQQPAPSPEAAKNLRRLGRGVGKILADGGTATEVV